MRLSFGLRPSSQALRACTTSAVGARRLHRVDESEQRFARLLLVDADAAFDRHRKLDRRGHRRDAFGDQRRLAHQAGAETAALHPVGRAAAIEVDLVIAEIGADSRRLGESRRVRRRRAAAPPDARPHRSRSAARAGRTRPRRR